MQELDFEWIFNKLLNGCFTEAAEYIIDEIGEGGSRAKLIMKYIEYTGYTDTTAEAKLERINNFCTFVKVFIR